MPSRHGASPPPFDTNAPFSVAFYLRRLLRVRKEALVVSRGRIRGFFNNPLKGGGYSGMLLVRNKHHRSSLRQGPPSATFPPTSKGNPPYPPLSGGQEKAKPLLPGGGRIAFLYPPDKGGVGGVPLSPDKKGFFNSPDKGRVGGGFMGFPFRCRRFSPLNPLGNSALRCRGPRGSIRTGRSVWRLPA